MHARSPRILTMPKETQVQIRLSYEEKAALEAQAERDRMPLALWIRRLALEEAARGEKNAAGKGTRAP